MMGIIPQNHQILCKKIKFIKICLKKKILNKRVKKLLKKLIKEQTSISEVDKKEKPKSLPSGTNNNVLANKVPQVMDKKVMIVQPAIWKVTDVYPEAPSPQAEADNYPATDECGSLEHVLSRMTTVDKFGGKVSMINEKKEYKPKKKVPLLTSEGRIRKNYFNDFYKN